MTIPAITGWDIGGAHLKVAQCNPAGQLIMVKQYLCPLWQGIAKLTVAIQQALTDLPNISPHHVITMTGELADIFSSRQNGVEAIITCITAFIPEAHCHIYAGSTHWLTPQQAITRWSEVASRNWEASATFAAQHIPEGLFVDVGSTTSDIIALVDHSTRPQAYTDFERQACHELHYFGAIRTPLIALAQTVPFQQRPHPIANELFATTGDCWVLLKQLPRNTIQDDSADGLGWDEQYCYQRLARLLGTDAVHYPAEVWLELANWFAKKQSEQLQFACHQVLNASPCLEPDAPLVGAGIGRFIIQRCAQAMQRPYIDMGELFHHSSDLGADHAPAAALVLLAHHQLA